MAPREDPPGPPSSSLARAGYFALEPWYVLRSFRAGTSTLPPSSFWVAQSESEQEMEDSCYIMFFRMPDDESAARACKDMHALLPGWLLIKHRPEKESPLLYSVQARKEGARFWDEDLDKLLALARAHGGEWVGQRSFHDPADFSKEDTEIPE